jgi:hypothetical protein
MASSAHPLSVVHMEQLGSPVLHARKVGKLCLQIVTSSGQRYTISEERLTPDQKEKLEELEAQLQGNSNASEIELDPDTCVCIRDGIRTFHSSDEPLIQGFRQLLRDHLKDPSLFKKEYHAGERTFAGKSEKPKSPRLASLEYTDKDLAETFLKPDLTTNEPLTFDQKKKLLMRRLAARFLLQASSTVLTQLEKDLPPGELLSQGRAKLIHKSKERLDSVSQFLLDFEMTHPSSNEKEALDRKKERASALIASREKSKDLDPEEEEFSKQLALNTLNGKREEYEPMCEQMGAQPTPEPLESFFINLVKDLKGSDFTRIFGSLHALDQELAQNLFVKQVAKLAQVIKTLSAIESGQKPSHRGGLRTWGEIGSNSETFIRLFGQEFSHLLG